MAPRLAQVTAQLGRVLHSSTGQLNVSAVNGLHASTIRLVVITLCGLRREVSSANKAYQVKLRSGRLL